MNFDQLIPSYLLGSDLVILDATYHFPNKQQVESYNGVKTVYTPDTMTIVYKDNTTGKKLCPCQGQIPTSTVQYWRILKDKRYSLNTSCSHEQEVFLFDFI